MKAKNKPSFFTKFLLWLNVLFIAGLLLSYLAGYINPEKLWPIAFFGLAYPILLLLNLLIAVYWLFRKSWYALLSLVCIVCGWNVLNNSIGFHKSGSVTEKIKDTNKIRIMTYNVHGFTRYGARKDTSTKHEILDIINTQQPDIIGFQEFYTKKRGQYDLRDSLLKILRTKYFYFESVIFNNDEDIGVAMFSKFPIISKGNIHITGQISENACLYIDVQKGNRKFRVYSVHLQSIHFDPIDYKYLNSLSDKGKADLLEAKRMAGKLKNAFRKRSGQVITIKSNAAQCPYPYIISGDFNDTPASFAVTQMSKGLKNAFREKGSGLGQTYNGDFPNYQIDYIMASPQFNIENYQVIEKRLSDHYPVRSDVLLK